MNIYDVGIKVAFLSNTIVHYITSR